MSAMTKRERVSAAIRGAEIDHPPAGFWGHDFLHEWSAADLAGTMLESAREFDYDFLKVNPRATYYAEAWGCAYHSAGDPNEGPVLDSYVLHDAADLDRIVAIDGTGGAFAEQLEALRLIGSGLAGQVPFVQTVFSPLSVVARLANGREPVVRWMTEEPERLHRALEAVTESLAQYAQASINAGADGIFFATTEWATPDACTPAQYAEFGRAYDLPVLEAVAGAPMNVLHVCRPNNMLLDLLDYPAGVVSWAPHAPGNASLAEVAGKTEKALMGGANERKTLLHGSPDDVRAEVAAAVAQTAGRRFLLAPGCSVPPQTPPESIRAAIAAVRGVSP